MIVQTLQEFVPMAVIGAAIAWIGQPVAPQGKVTVACPRVTSSYDATVTRVVDGDTLDVQLELGFGIQYSTRVRLEGIDTPEMFSVPWSSEEYARGLAAKKFAESWLEAYGRSVIVSTEGRTGKHGRIIGVIYPPDGKSMSLNKTLLDSRHAVPFVKPTMQSLVEQPGGGDVR